MEWTSGLFALAGALLGGLVTLVGTLVSLRDGARRARDERLAALRSEQRQLCQEYLASLDGLQNDVEQLLGGAGPRDAENRSSRDQLHAQYVSSWRAFTTASAAVRVSCPEPVVQSADDLRKQATNWAVIVDRISDGVRAQGLEAQTSATNESKHAFAKVVRDALAQPL